MDLVSLAASIITIADVSWKLVQYLEGVKDGDKSRRALLDEVTLMWLVYRGFEEEFEISKGVLIHESRLEPLKLLTGPQGVTVKIREHLEDLAEKLLPKKGRFGEVITSLKWPFKEKELLRLVDRLRDLRQTTTTVLQQANFRTNQEIHDGVQEIQTLVQDNHFQEVLEWLTPLNFLLEQQEVLGSADPHLCSILSSKLYWTWHEGDMRTLWCWGSPGAGKSVAAASIYSQLVKQHRTENIATMIVFCKFDNEKSQRPRDIVASLLKQALQASNGNAIPPKLKEHYKKSTTSKGNEALGLQEITVVLRDLLKAKDSVFVVVDGLDEVSGQVRDLTREAVVKAIHAIGANAKILITSRHSEDITQALQAIQSCEVCKTKDADIFWRCKNSSCPYILCEPCHSSAIAKGTNKHKTSRELQWKPLYYEPTDSDINNYVEHRLDSEAELRFLLGPESGQEELKQLVVDTVADKSENTFLLARLHMDSLSNCLSLGELKRVLGGLVANLDHMYSQSLERMEKTLKKPHFRRLKSLLLWVAWGRRPLTVSELGHALAIRPGIQTIQDDDILPIRRISTWSAGLLFIDSADYVRVIHPTTSQFFMERRDQLYPRGESIIAHDCLNYLSMKALSEPVSGSDEGALFTLRRRAFAFLAYAVLHCFEHVSRSLEKDDDNRAVGFLLSPSRQSFVQALYYLDYDWSVPSDASPLHVATYLGLTDVVLKLTEEGQDVNARDSYGITPLMYAATRGVEGLPAMNCLLKANADPGLTCDEGLTALMRAVKLGAQKLVDRLLMEPDININAAPPSGRRYRLPALMFAVESRALAIVRKLIAREDLDINIADVSGRTALYTAASLRDADILTQLLTRKGINTESAAGSQKIRPLHIASGSGFTEGVKLLLAHGADLQSEDAYKGNALMRAVDGHSKETAELLIERGIDTTRRDFLGRTALHAAAINCSWDCMSLLLEKTPYMDINSQGNAGETPLHDACRRKGLRGVSMLVNAGASCDIEDNEGRNAVDIANWRRFDDALELLKKAKGYANAVGVRKPKTLEEAISSDPSNILQARIENASPQEINHFNSFDGTPLHRACSYGRADVIKMLLQAGADANVTDSFGRPPLVHVIKTEHFSCLKILLDHGVELNRWREAEHTLWEHAWNCNCRRAALALIEYGAEIDIRSGYLLEALHQAAFDDNLAATKRIVEAGVSVHKKIQGRSAIYHAESQGSTSVLQYFASLQETSIGEIRT